MIVSDAISCGVTYDRDRFIQGILKGEVSLYC